MGIREHLRGRGLDPDGPGILLDEERGIATFLLWDLSGRLCGYQQYNPEGTKRIRNDEAHRFQLKYFTYAGIEGDGSRAGRKKLVAYGFESLRVGQDFLFLVEGVFDAVKLHNLGLPALAMLANDPEHLRPLVRALGRWTVALCDRDDAGRRLASCADASLSVPEPFHDVGDMPQEDVELWLRTAFIRR